jgi:hypothetical protein
LQAAAGVGEADGHGARILATLERELPVSAQAGALGIEQAGVLLAREPP